ncbi:porin [Methylobacillus gramineus]|uniref:porin n=1 Tax=Methylobacillus gramineus TaxID=755169 RepID=UPI001CFFE621|nr:porin [Methylobacillus gramineus]MCB5185791.1 porin [Methylobacillus gramineus]
MNYLLPLIALLLGISITSLAQAGETNSEHPLTISGYAEAYYLRDFNKPANNKRPEFIYSHNRADEPSINLALIHANISTERFRANLGIATGTYMRANYAAEPGLLNNLYEANLGFKLSDTDELWLDVGVMPSHIGFESAIGKDNWTVTRSLVAENSPYFETGAKLSYTSADGKWMISGLLLNGWQRIQRADGNTTPAIGHQLTYKPNDRVTVNSSSLIGNDKSDQQRQMRYFHNLYGQFQLDRQWSVIAGLDIGAEQVEKGSSRYHTWFAPVIIARYSATDKLSLAARAEYYQDKHGVIVSTGTPDGFQVFGYSFNVDYRISPHLLWRNEVRKFNSPDAIFMKGNDTFTSGNLMAVTALAISF